MAGALESSGQVRFGECIELHVGMVGEFAVILEAFRNRNIRPGEEAVQTEVIEAVLTAILGLFRLHYTEVSANTHYLGESVSTGPAGKVLGDELIGLAEEPVVTKNIGRYRRIYREQVVELADEEGDVYRLLPLNTGKGQRVYQSPLQGGLVKYFTALTIPAFMVMILQQKPLPDDAWVKLLDGLGCDAPGPLPFMRLSASCYASALTNALGRSLSESKSTYSLPQILFGQ